MTGVIMIPEDMPVGDAIKELEIITSCSELEEFAGKVVFLPLRKEIGDIVE